MKTSPMNIPAIFLILLCILCLYAYSNKDRRPSSARYLSGGIRTAPQIKALPSPGSFSGPQTQAKPRVPAKKAQPEATKKPVANPPAAATKPTDKEDMSEGERLIAKSDCLGCHKVQTKLVGPAYTDVAQKYTLNKANIQLLTDKVIKGGTGVWGQIPMSAHLSLSREDAQKMIAYILSLHIKQQ